jgi:hypothetical protein
MRARARDRVGVGRREAVGHVHREIEQFLRRIDGRDGAAVHELHDQKVRADIIELADVGMVEY